jgi:hypothetical protein
LLKAIFEILQFLCDQTLEQYGADAHEQSKAVDLVPQRGCSAVARVGDLFQLGPHRLMCGDGNDPDVVKRLMQTDVARVV